MRLKVLAFCLCTSAITPTAAHAGPVVAFIGSFVTSVLSAATGVLSGFAATGVGSFLTTSVVGKALVGIGLSVLQAAYAASQIPTPEGRMTNHNQPVQFQELAWGQVRKGGPEGFYGFAKKRRHSAILLAAHEIESIEALYLDEDQVTTGDVNAINYGLTPHVVNQEPYFQQVRLHPYLGVTGQAVDPIFLESFPGEITSAHDFAGLAYLATWSKKVGAERFGKVYPNGEHVKTALIKGNNQVYDPRIDARGWSKNAALVIASMFEYWGVAIDWARVAVEADVCDELVLNKEGGYQPRWTIDTVLDASLDFETMRAAMGLACDAFFWERPDGVVDFRVGRYEASEITLSQDDFYELTISHKNFPPSAATEFFSVYTEPENGYKSAPSGTWVEVESNTPIRHQSEVYPVDNHNAASRLNKTYAKAARAEYQISGRITASKGLALHESDNPRFPSFINAELGLAFSTELHKLVRLADGSYEVALRSTAPSDREFDAATEEPDRPEFETVNQVDEVEDLAGLAINALQSTGGSAAVDVDWSEADDLYRQQIRLRAPGTDHAAWQVYEVPSGIRPFRVTGLLDAEVYEVQGRNLTGGGLRSDWLPDPALSFTAIANQTPPSALISFAAAVSGADVDLSFTPANEEVYAATRIYRADYPGGYSGPYEPAEANLIHTEFGISSTTDAYTDPALATGHYAYWAVPINASGVEGPDSGPQTVNI